MPHDSTLPAQLAAVVAEYQRHANVGVLMDQLRGIIAHADTDALKSATTPFRDLPEVVIPVFEAIIRREPKDAQAMVVLANAYWLTGRGPDMVGALAQRAIDADATNRGAWHLWALAESDVRSRLERWRLVTRQFPGDQLARAALADNATSLASAEEDPLALDLAIETYEGLLAESINAAQSAALVETLDKLRKWRM